MLKLLRYLDWRAIGIGVLTNLLLSFCLLMVALIFCAMALSAKGLNEHDIRALFDDPWQSPLISLTLLTVGAVGDYAAGIMTARVAKRLELFQTLAMMLFMLAVNQWLGDANTPLVYGLLANVMGFAAAFYGAYREKLRKLGLHR